MKNVSLLVAGACALPVVVAAQDLEARVVSRHHFGVSLPVWLNAKAKFTAARATNPGPLGGGVGERFYDDGYSRVDSSGNAPAVLGGPPSTSFFGYASAAQVDNLPGTDTLSLHAIQLNGGDYTRNLSNQPQFPGVDLFYRYDWQAGAKWRLSWELGAAYNCFHWEQNGAPNSTVDLLTDVFALGGVNLAPGAAPYNGPFTALPGSPVIGSTPGRTQGTAAAAVTGVRKLEFHALQMRVGPALDWVPNDQWTVGVQGGWPWEWAGPNWPLRSGSRWQPRTSRRSARAGGATTRTRGPGGSARCASVANSMSTGMPTWRCGTRGRRRCGTTARRARGRSI
jgi:hypothetical protein